MPKNNKKDLKCKKCGCYMSTKKLLNSHGCEKLQKELKKVEEVLKESGLLKRENSKKTFEKWKKEWFEQVPKCKEFVCCHELMSCGINYLCGDCSIYETWKRKRLAGEDDYCNDIDCNDCIYRQYDEDVKCEKGLPRFEIWRKEL